MGFNFLSTKEDFLVVEQLSSSYKTTPLSLEEKLNLEVGESEVYEELKDIAKNRSGADKIFFSLNPRSATTIERTIELKREEPDQKITDQELDKLIYKALWRFLDQNRDFASEKLGVPDLDMVLSDLQIINAQLDSQKIFHPVGFKGEALYLTVRGTFVPREISNIPDYFSELGSEVKVLEGLALSSSFLKEFDKVFHLHENSSHVFSKTEDLKFNTTYQVGINDLLDSLATPLSIDRRSSAEILDKYFDNRLSKRFRNFIDKKISGFVSKLEEILEEVSENSEHKIALNIPKKLHSSQLKKEPNSEVIDYKEFLEKKGFNVILKGRNEPEVVTNYHFLAFAGEPLFETHYPKMNNLLKRRSEWLVSEK